MPVDPEIPRGIVFFPANVSPTYRRRRIIFAVLGLMATLSLTWPVYPFFSKIYPMLFNLPFALGWLIIWLVLTMAGLLWLYRTEKY